jgi:ribose 5-phosphate isomerase B
MKIYLGTDHAGFELKEKLKPFLAELGHEVEDLGSFSFDKNDDYPDITTEVANKTSADNESFGIIIGGSGQGEAMVANRKSGIRCVVFYGGVTPKIEVDIEGRKSDDNFEILKLSRMHNNANMLSISARFVSEDEAKEAVKIWLETPFSGDERHIRRISKF